MGDLIVMTRPTRLSRSDAPKGGTAEILFFMGVRYTRLTDADADAALASVTPPRRATKPRRRAIKATDAKRA